MKKYINDIDHTATTTTNPLTKLDYNYNKDMGINGSTKQSERRESHRGRSGSNKKKKSTTANGSSTNNGARGHSAHLREDSYSKRE